MTIFLAMTNKEHKTKLIFGHKDLVHREHRSIAEMATAVSFDLTLCKFKIPSVRCLMGFEVAENKVSAKKYLKFSLENIQKNNESGFLDSITNSKRAIIRRYDEILSDCLSLQPTSKPKFKILTNELGIYIPGLIKDFVIDPRNIFEYEYGIPDNKTAQRAYEVARLFIDSTELVLSDLIKSIEFGVFEHKFGRENMLRGFDIRFGKHTSKNGNRFLITYEQDNGATGDYCLIDVDHKSYNNFIFLASKYSRAGEDHDGQLKNLFLDN